MPLHVDAERLYAETVEGVAETARLIADTGAAGFSIEDYDPRRDRIDARDEAVARVAAAAGVATEHGLVLTARAENHLYRADGLDDTIGRLRAYRDAGAHVVYAPGLSRLDEIARVVREVGLPLNVLALRDGPSVGELASVGVRRVSTGGALAFAAYGALVAAGEELLGPGTSEYVAAAVDGRRVERAFTR